MSLISVLVLGCGRIGFDELVTVDEARGTLSVGSGFACTLRGTEVWCWGESSGGQLGVGVLDFSTTPVEVTGVPDPVSLSAGDQHVCAVTGAGDVYCWGSNQFLQLGFPLPAKPGRPNSAMPIPQRVASLPLPAIAVDTATQHTCALLEDRTVWCWGSNRTGALGRGTVEEVDLLPDVVPGLTDVAELAIADDSSCVRHTSGKVSCWGEGGAGHLGDGTTASRGTPGEIPGLIADTLVLGGDHGCALVGGKFTCWGANAFGQHGDGTDVGTDRPEPLSVDDGFVAITASFTHTCGQRDDGTLLCWGGNNEATLGDGTTDSRSAPTLIDVGGRVVSAAAGFYSTCAIREDNAVMCWGWGSRGGIGDGRSAQARPQGVEIDASRIAASRTHTCAVVTGGNVACWGLNNSGELGDDTRVLRTEPVTVSRGWNANALEVTLGDRHSCILTVAGEVWCWGDNTSGQLGNGTFDAAGTPVQAMVPPMSKIAAGDLHTCGIVLADSRVQCWGYNDDGELGNGLLMPSALPVQVLDETGGDLIASELAIGENHSCALRGTQVLCWGANNRGQLGSGTANQTKAIAVPMVVADGLISGAIAICASDPFTANPKCWGANDNNILVDADLDPIAPTSVQHPDGFAIGRATACDLADGCWGTNFLGQLGDGSFGGRTDPMPIVDLPVAPSAITMGIDHTCAIAGGKVFCWGDNVNGELGIGATSRARVPTPVSGLP